MIEPFNLTVVQPAVRPVFKGTSGFRRDALDENLAKACDYVRVAAKYHKSRVILFPEFFLHGFELGRSTEEWIEASVRIPGPETAALGAVARSAGSYLAGMVYEVLDDFPGRYWNTAVILDPQGRVALTYRKVYAMTGKTRPGDVYTDYTQRFGGPQALFPVLRTPYGNLGCLTCYDVNFPEVTRCLALHGAEIFLHCASETRSPYHLPDGGWTLAKRVRAYENLAYFATANQGPVVDGDYVADRHHGHSQIIDFDGRVMNMAETSGETMITAEIDIEALRRRRQRPSANFLAELSPQIHAPIYASARAFPLDRWASKPMTGVAENRHVEEETIARMTAGGILQAPGKS
ncbi:MAG TPA: nitrilase-related carbon-nitrogen hydrolase [Steroidobacteraceae bacterium]|nr:nitrilase-related carbon-nitrogen hydrolase [Steroidobacteraceae bacterium]